MRKKFARRITLFFVFLILSGYLFPFVLADTNIVILNKNYAVKQGEKLETLVTLTPESGTATTEITLRYRIMDSLNRVLHSERAAIRLKEMQEVRRNFGTGSLEKGDYILSLDITSQNTFESSSAHFSITVREIPEVLGKIILFLAILTLIISIILLTIMITKKVKIMDKKRETNENFIGSFS